MGEPLISPAKYVAVLIALVLLTVVTVGISFLDLPGTWHLIAGVSIGVCKASLVALFFMHLIHSHRAVRGVVLLSLFWLVIVLIGLTFSDYATRLGWPNAPGH